MTNIILCDGSGTLMAKQLVRPFDDKSLFQLTVERNSAIRSKQLIILNAEYYFLALDQLEEIKQVHNQYILEPLGRDTAAATALACMSLDSDETVLITPSDHLIKDQTTYQKILICAQELALENNLVTFRITPTFPKTGFGYIETQVGEYTGEDDYKRELV